MIALRRRPGSKGVPDGAQEARRFPRSVLAAIPACLAGLAVVAASVAAFVVPTQDALVANYSQGATRLVQARNYRGAQAGFERLVELEPRQPDYLYGLVLSLEAVGQGRRAEALARRLAPPDQTGYPAAQVWLGRRLATRAGHDAVAARDAERHLRLVPSTHPLSIEAHESLGTMLLNLGRPDFAERDLKKAQPERPEIQLWLSQTYLRQGNVEAARTAAAKAVVGFRERLTAEPRDMASRLSLATATVVQEEFVAAEKILNEGLSQRDDPRYHQFLADLYAAWSDSLARDGGTLATRLELLERGLRHDPCNETIMLRLVRVIQTGGPDAERARAAIRTLAASRKAGAGADFVLGIDAWERGLRDEARTRWESALRQAPTFAAAANNLAELLADSQPPELDRALKLSGVALEHLPNNPFYRDTRGRILLKLGRWSDGLADLEAVLAGGANPPGLHDALAQAYDHLGDSAMAAEHRNLTRHRNK